MAFKLADGKLYQWSFDQVNVTLDVSLTPLRGYTPDYTLKISGATFHKDYCFR
jgi:hypothetical protein